MSKAEQSTAENQLSGTIRSLREKILPFLDEDRKDLDYQTYLDFLKNKEGELFFMAAYGLSQDYIQYFSTDQLRSFEIELLHNGAQELNSGPQFIGYIRGVWETRDMYHRESKYQKDPVLSELYSIIEPYADPIQKAVFERQFGKDSPVDEFFQAINPYTDTLFQGITTSLGFGELSGRLRESEHATLRSAKRLIGYIDGCAEIFKIVEDGGSVAERATRLDQFRSRIRKPSHEYWAEKGNTYEFGYSMGVSQATGRVLSILEEQAKQQI